jgi:hypothetical protein
MKLTNFRFNYSITILFIYEPPLFFSQRERINRINKTWCENSGTIQLWIWNICLTHFHTLKKKVVPLAICWASLDRKTPWFSFSKGVYNQKTFPEIKTTFTKSERVMRAPVWQGITWTLSRSLNIFAISKYWFDYKPITLFKHEFQSRWQCLIFLDFQFRFKVNVGFSIYKCVNAQGVVVYHF